MKKTVFAIAALAVTGAFTSLATSPAMAQMPSETIDTTAYDVDTPEGYASVARQIHHAAGRVCGNVDLRNLDIAPEWRACRNETRADGMEQLAQISRGGNVTIVASR